MAWSKNTTIAEIARNAKVSIATVSRVINQSGKVKAETRDHVLQVMESLNFIVNPLRQTSVSSRFILVSFPDLENPFNNEIIRGIRDVAAQNGLGAFFYQPFNHQNAVHTYESMMEEHKFAGMILLHTINDRSALEEMCKQYPMVMCSEHYKSDTIPFVAIDDYSAAKTAIGYLLSIGRKKIALINSSLQYNYAKHRERGYMDSLMEAGITANPRWITHMPDINFYLAVSVATSMLQTDQLDQRPDAFFCVSDIFAAAVIKAASNLGISVPGDIAVVGFDNIELATMIVPPITTISQPAYQLGVQACNLLIEQMQNHQPINKHIILNTELIVRAST